MFLFESFCVMLSHLLGVCVEGDRHVEQQLPVFDSPDKVLDPDLQVSGCLVDFLRVALSSLSQLLSRLQQFVRIGVCVLRGEERPFVVIVIRSNTVNTVKSCVDVASYRGHGTYTLVNAIYCTNSSSVSCHISNPFSQVVKLW